MSYVIDVTLSAEKEIEKAKEWYEGQQYGLGEEFEATVKNHIYSLTDKRVEHKMVFDNVRRILVDRFPYIIYYIRNELEQIIIVVAVLHNKRLEPKY